MSYEHDYQSLISKWEALRADFEKFKDNPSFDENEAVLQRMMWLLEKMVTLLAPEARD